MQRGLDIDELLDWLKRTRKPVAKLVSNLSLEDEVFEILFYSSYLRSDVLRIASMNKAKIQHIFSEDSEFDKIPWIKRIWLSTTNH